MGGTKDGARKARDKLLAKNPNHYSDISKKAKKARGGKAYKHSFQNNVELAKIAGAKGGKKSRRGPAKKVSS